jgi:hypothetical protein
MVPGFDGEMISVDCLQMAEDVLRQLLRLRPQQVGVVSVDWGVTGVQGSAKTWTFCQHNFGLG